MGCGCSGGKSKKYEYIAPDGRVTVVQTQTEAIAAVRAGGGTWRMKTA
jgi:hypothetical protein